MKTLVRRVFPAADLRGLFPVRWTICHSHNEAWKLARRHAQFEGGEASVHVISDSEAAVLTRGMFWQDEPPTARAYDAPQEGR